MLVHCSEFGLIHLPKKEYNKQSNLVLAPEECYLTKERIPLHLTLGVAFEFREGRLAFAC